MKILKLKIRNVRSYRKADIEFSPFLNVVKGRSDSGKSGLVKSIEFNVDNLVTKNTRTKGTENTSLVSLSDGNITVIRKKDDDVNGYDLIIGKEKTKHYQAVGKQVPFEVSKALNLTEANIQKQKDTYFLIDKPDGMISKTLNKVSGLSEIDRTLKLITTEINLISSDIRAVNNSIKEDKEKIEDNQWSIKADIDLKIIEKLELDLSELEIWTKDISRLVIRYTEIKDELDSFIPDALPIDYNAIVRINGEISIIDNYLLSISSLINNYTKTKSDLQSIEIVDPTELKTIQQKIDELTTEEKSIAHLLRSYTSIKMQLTVAEENLAKTEKKLSGVKLCPTCKRPMELKYL